MMASSWRILLLYGATLCSLISAQSFSKDLHLIGSIKTKNPSFVELLDLSGSHSSNPLDLNLVITNFAERGTNGISSFNNIGRFLSNISNGDNLRESVLADKTLTWPNFVYIAEDGIFPAESTLMVHDGFLPPGHKHGGVYILMLNDSKPVGDVIRIEEPSGKCYYHNSTMIDLNGDGLKDLLLAQTCAHMFGGQKGELIWMEQPSSNVTAPGSWTKHSLVEGPDILIETQRINDSTLIVFAAQFWTSELKYYYLRIGKEGGPSILNQEGVLIDNSIGAVYDVQIVDLLKNGKKQLLVNDHIADGTKNGVFLYQFPENHYPDPKGKTFTKYQIAGGFNTSGGVGVGAPGFVTPFDLNEKEDRKKPFKLGVAGDGNFITWQLTLEDKKKMKYKKEVIQSVGGTSGIMAFGDVDGDGWTEAFVPYYEKNEIFVYTANPHTFNN